ncbi:MAG: hypothetical protein ABIH42_05285 [Planctomycetota bacterium]
MKFYNPTNYLVSFNVARRLADGATVPKWISVEPKNYFVAEDKEVLEVAAQQTELKRTMDSRKGYLVEVEDKDKAVKEEKVEKPKKSK